MLCWGLRPPNTRLRAGQAAADRIMGSTPGGEAMKRFTALGLTSALVALELFLSVIALGGCAMSAPARVPQSAMVVSYNSAGGE
jgi:hypothetical protein